MHAMIAMAAALTMAHAPAADPCANPPPAALTYLKEHPGWRILRVADMWPDDRALWNGAHPHLCPGMAEVDFDGTGKNYVALSTVRPDRDGLVETVVIVRQDKHGLDVHTVWRDEPGYDVVWRVGPMTVHEWDDAKNRVHIPHQSLVVERLESASRQYYRKDGQFRYVQTSD